MMSQPSLQIGMFGQCIFLPAHASRYVPGVRIAGQEGPSALSCWLWLPLSICGWVLFSLFDCLADFHRERKVRDETGRCNWKHVMGKSCFHTTAALFFHSGSRDANQAHYFLVAVLPEVMVWSSGANCSPYTLKRAWAGFCAICWLGHT
jgi:hypothetical protein